MEILSRPVTFRVLAAATAVLLGIGLIGAVTVDDAEDTVTPTAETTTTLPAGQQPPGAPGEPAPGDPGQPAPGEPAPTVPATNGAATAHPPAPSGEPAALSPTRPGLYRYKVTEDDEERRSELRVTPEEGAPRGEQWFVHRESEEGATSESSVAWRAEGVYERSRTFPSATGGPGGRCDWEPDLLLAPRPLRADSTWSWDTRCSSEIEGQKADFHYTGNARVAGAERIGVGGRQVDTWRIESQGKITITGNSQGRPFTVVIELTSSVLLAPEQGVVARSDETAKFTGPTGQTDETRTVRELQNLDPA